MSENSAPVTQHLGRLGQIISVSRAACVDRSIAVTVKIRVLTGMQQKQRY